MPNNNDPFDDIGRFQSLLSNKTPADLKKNQVEDVAAEVLEEEDVEVLKTVSDELDKFENVKIEPQRKEEVRKTFNGLYSQLNEKYGLELKMDAESFSDMMANVIDPRAKKALELYLSEAYGRFRAMLYNKFLNAIAALADQLLDPNYLLSEEIPYTEKLILMRQLFEFMSKIEAIYAQVDIQDADTKLEHLNDETTNNSSLSDPGTRELLAQLLGKVPPKEEKKEE